MRYLWTAFRLSLLARLRRWRTWAAVALVLLAALAVRLSPAEEALTPVTVGVVLPPEGGEDFWRGLEEREPGLVRFVRTDPETLRRQVSAGRWDCALTLAEDFPERLPSLDLDGVVTVTVGPGSTVYPLVQETAAAVLTALAAPAIAEAYLASGPLAGTPLPELEEVRRVGISLRTPGGRPLGTAELASSGRDGLLRAAAAALLLVWALSTAVDLGRWLETAEARRTLACRSAPALLLPRLLAALVPPLAAAALGLRTAACGGAAALLPYGAAVGALALALASLPWAWRALPPLIPLAAVSVFVLSPAVVDVGALFPGLSPLVEALPATLYLRACQGDGGAVLRLLALAAVLAVLARLASMLKRQ